MHFRDLGSIFREKNKLILNWLNRYYINVEKYDIVIGYRADDAYFRFPTHFINTELSIEDLESAFLSGCLEMQYAFVSEKAIKSLKFKRAIICEPRYLGIYFKTVKELTIKIDELLNKERDPNKTYVLDLMRKDNE